MPDTLTPQQRSKCMAAIRGKHTMPERLIRSIAHRLGFRCSLHASDIPGKPDLTFRSRRALIFVHGCFWHMHRCRRGQSTPTTNAAFWRKKREGNRDRDRRNIRALRRQGWRVLVIWECQTRDADRLRERLVKFLRYDDR